MITHATASSTPQEIARKVERGELHEGDLLQEEVKMLCSGTLHLAEYSMVLIFL